MKKTVLITSLVLVVAFLSFYFINNRSVNNEQNKDKTEVKGEVSDFVKCLIDSGMVIYGSKTCPACADLSRKFGGYEKMGELFVSCGDERTRCEEEMQTNYVPEIQINGELFQEGRELEDFAKATGCEL